MPSLTTTIEDTSPLIVYSGNDWQTGSSNGDIYAEQYSQSSYMVTNVTNARASFAFYGNGLQLFGAKRPYHGYYQISIDSNVYPKVNGSVAYGNGTFQTPLFSTAALESGYHTVTITNVDVLNVDLDFITWQTPVGLDAEQIIATTVQDSDSSFVYTPASVWSTKPPNLGMFLGGSAHTTKSDADVEFTFTGGAVALYGPVGPDCGPYSVSLDGNTPTNYSATKQFYRPQQMLYQASNLGGKEHKVLIQSQVGGYSAMYFAVDYAMVYTTPSLQSAGQPKAISVGGIVGIALGGIFGLLIILALVYYCIRSKGRKSKLFAMEPFSPVQQYTAVQSNPASATTTQVGPGQQQLLTPLGSDFGVNTQVITVSDQHEPSSFSLMSPPHVREGESTQGTHKRGLGQTSPTPSNMSLNSEARQRMPRILEEKRQLAQATTRSFESGFSQSAQVVQQGRNAAPLITPDAMDMPPEYYYHD